MSTTACLLLLLSIFLLPSSFQLTPIAVPMGPFFLTAVEMCILAILSIYILNVFLNGKNLAKPGLFKHQVWMLLLLYAGHVAYGIAINGAIPALGDFRQYSPLVLYFPIVSIGLTERNVDRFRSASFWVLAAVAAYVLILFMYFPGVFIKYAPKEHARILKDRVFFDNTLFLFFIYLGYLIASVCGNQKPLSTRVFFGIVVCTNLLMLMISQTRNLWVMFLIVSLATVFLFESGLIRVKYLFVSTYVTLLLICLLYLGIHVFDYTPSVLAKIQDSLIERASSILLIDQVDRVGMTNVESIGSIVTRIETAKVVWNEYIKPNWLFGTGFGTQLPMVYNRQVYLWKYQIDNGYLTILAKFGFLGLGIYLSMFLKIVKNSINILRSNLADPADRLVAKSILVGMLAIIFGSLFSSIFIRAQASIAAFVIVLCEIEILRNKVYARLEPSLGDRKRIPREHGCAPCA